MNSQCPDADRRLSPGILDTDWLPLRGLSAAVSRFVQEQASPGTAALDFGCGDQPYRILFETRGIEYRGADFGTSAQICISESGRVDAPASSVDLVLSFQVLEHVRDLDIYFAEVKRLLRPGGRLLLSTHGTWLYHPHPEDHRRWTRTGLISELAGKGFEVEACTPIVGPLAWSTVLRLTGYCYVLRKIPVLGSFLGKVLAALMNGRAWLEDWITPESFRRDNACIYLVVARVVGDGP